MTLTEQMKSFVDEVTSTRNDRTDAVARFKNETEQLLNSARAGVKQLASEHQEMAKQLQAQLANHAKTRLEQAQSQRDNARREIRETGVGIRKMLEQSKADRKRQMTELLQTFQQARQLLTADIHEASQAWQRVHGDRPAADGGAEDRPASHNRKRHHASGSRQGHSR